MLGVLKKLTCEHSIFQPWQPRIMTITTLGSIIFLEIKIPSVLVSYPWYITIIIYLLQTNGQTEHQAGLESNYLHYHRGAHAYSSWHRTSTQSTPLTTTRESSPNLLVPLTPTVQSQGLHKNTISNLFPRTNKGHCSCLFSRPTQASHPTTSQQSEMRCILISFSRLIFNPLEIFLSISINSAINIYFHFSSFTPQYLQTSVSGSQT